MKSIALLSFSKFLKSKNIFFLMLFFYFTNCFGGKNRVSPKNPKDTQVLIELVNTSNGVIQIGDETKQVLKDTAVIHIKLPQEINTEMLINIIKLSASKWAHLMRIIRNGTIAIITTSFLFLKVLAVLYLFYQKDVLDFFWTSITISMNFIILMILSNNYCIENRDLLDKIRLTANDNKDLYFFIPNKLPIEKIKSNLEATLEKILQEAEEV